MEDLYMSDVVNILTTIPSTDGNFVSALKRATQDELDEAIVFIEKNPIGQIARKYAILAEKRRRKKAAGQNKEKTTQMDMFQMNGFVDVAASDIPELFADSNDENKEKIIETDDKMETISNQDEVIPMGTTSLMEIMQGISQGIPQGLPKPTEEEILNAKKENSSITEVTNETFLGNNSKKADASNVEYDDVDTSFVDFALSLGNIDSCEYLQVVEKLNREMMHFSDDENLYVLNGLLKAAREDSALARGILNENKTYEKAFNYFASKSRENGVKLEKCYWLTKEKALPLAIEYYKIDEEEAAREKAEKKVECKKNEAKKKPRKRSTKKKDVVISNTEYDTKSVEGLDSSSKGLPEEKPDEIPDMSASKSANEKEKDDQNNDFLSKFANFSFGEGEQLSFI